jgi:hypothetical protein
MIVLTGQTIAKSNWSPRERAYQAARWKLGLLDIEPITRMAASVFRVSTPLIDDAVKRLEPAITARKANGNGIPRTIDVMWNALPEDEQTAFVRAHLAQLWDRIDLITR